jgi:SHS2 domain-containing protein
MSDDTIVKQFPYDLKLEATSNGYRIHAHAYGESSDGVVTESVNMILKAMTECEIKGIPLAANAQRIAK